MPCAAAAACVTSKCVHPTTRASFYNLHLFIYPEDRVVLSASHGSRADVHRAGIMASESDTTHVLLAASSNMVRAYSNDDAPGQAAGAGGGDHGRAHRGRDSGAPAPTPAVGCDATPTADLNVPAPGPSGATTVDADASGTAGDGAARESKAQQAGAEAGGSDAGLDAVVTVSPASAACESEARCRCNTVSTLACCCFGCCTKAGWAYTAARGLAKLSVSSFFRNVHVSGISNVPRTGPLLVVAYVLLAT